MRNASHHRNDSVPADALIRRPVGGVAVREQANAAAKSASAWPAALEPRPVANHTPSQHTVSLHGIIVMPVPPKPVQPPTKPVRGIIGRMRHAFDVHVYLHDLRMRTLSIRPRGLQDFPPAGSVTMQHALRITSSKFFNEHPLAELTALSVLHLAALTIMHVARLPHAIAAVRRSAVASHIRERAAEARAPRVKAPSFAAPTAPVMPPAPKPVRVAVTAAPQPVRKLPLRAALAVWLSPTARAMQAKRPVTQEVRVSRRNLSSQSALLYAPIKEREDASARAAGLGDPASAQGSARALVGMSPDRTRAAASNILANKTVKPQRAQSLTLPFRLLQRSAFGFAGIALLLALPLGVYGSWDALATTKDAVVTDALDAANMLQAAANAAKNRDFVSANHAFAQANDGFASATERLGALASVLNAAPKLLPGTAISSAGPLLNAAREIAQGGEQLSGGMIAANGMTDPTGKLASLKASLAIALPHLERASLELARVSVDSVPAEYRDTVAQAQQDVPKLTGVVRRAGAIAEAAGLLLGATGPRRYLVIFQNNAEIRPTGGFMGSFALVDVEKGKLTSMEIPGGGTYDIKGQLTARVSSPQPMHLINPLWQFQDANWYPDFPTSAKQIAWFYEKSGGPTTDGVIAVNASLMQQLLAVTGPIDMPEYGKVITADNFALETQKAVELEYDRKENKPKQFIADLAPKVLEKLLATNDSGMLLLAAVMDDALSMRDVQIWSRDAETQQRVSALGWGGEMKATTGDFLSVVHTNIAGQKTDLVMHDAVDHAVKVLPDGTGIVTLTLTRTHEGQKGAAFSGVRNVDYVRFYVPQGSMLVEARGFTPPDPKLFKLGDGTEGEDPAVAASEKSMKVDRESGTRMGEENGKTVFGNWMQTDPGTSSTVTLVYQLPPGTVTVTRAPEGTMATLYGKLVGNRRDRIDSSLLVQKQAGTNPMTFTSSVDLPRGFTPSWQAPRRTEDDRGRWSVTAKIDRDAFFATVAEGL